MSKDISTQLTKKIDIKAAKKATKKANKLSRKKTKRKQHQSNVYSYFETFLLSVYSPDVYVDAKRRWTGVGAFYLLFIAFILSFPLFIQMVYSINQYFNKYIEPSVQMMPDLLIRHGSVTIVEKGTDKPAAKQVWIWPPAPTAEFKTPFFLITPTRSLQMFKSKFIPILIAHDGFQLQVIKPFSTEKIAQAIPIPMDTDRLLGADEFGAILKKFKQDLIHSGYSSMAFFIGSGLVMTVFFLAFLGKALSSMLFSYTMTWKESVRLLAVATTPALVFIDIVNSFTSVNQYWGIAALVLVTLYYFFGIRACRMDRAPAWNPSLGSLGFEK